MLQLKLLEANSIRRLIKYQFLNIDAKSGTSYKVRFGQYCFCDLIESLGLGRRESIVLLAKIATPFDSDWTFLFAEASFPLYDIYIRIGGESVHRQISHNSVVVFADFVFRNI